MQTFLQLMTICHAVEMLIAAITRGIGRIFQGGVQFVEILPLFKNHAHYSQAKSHNIQHYEGVLYCSLQHVTKRVAS